MAKVEGRLAAFSIGGVEFNVSDAKVREALDGIDLEDLTKIEPPGPFIPYNATFTLETIQDPLIRRLREKVRERYGEGEGDADGSPTQEADPRAGTKG